MIAGSRGAAVPDSPREVEPQAERQQKSGVGDLPLKGASAQTRSEQERYRSVQAGGMTAQPTNFVAATLKDADECGQKKAAERDAPPSRADERSKQTPKKASKALWAAVVLLALVLTGVAGYGYLVVRQKGITLSQLPGIAQVLGTLPQVHGTLHSRMDATEAKLRDVTAN